MSSIDKIKSESARLSVPALHMVRDDGDRFSRIGGIPLVPPDFSWPKWKGESLTFLAQMDLSEVATELTQPWMPTDGRLYFFYDKGQSTWGFDPADRGSWMVVYSDVPRSYLVEAAVPAGIGRNDIYASTGVTFRKIASLPDWQRLQTDTEDMTLEQFEELAEVHLSEFAGAPKHQLFGYPIPVQGDMMELECQLASNGVYCGTPEGYQSPLAAKLAPGAQEWRLLLQLDSDDDAGMMWGDVGTLYFWIRESDAQQKDFGKSWMILQCA